MSRRAWRKGVYESTTLLAVILLLLIMFISAAYFFLLPGPAPPTEQKQALARLAESRDAWDARRPRSYRYVVDRSCSCPKVWTEPFVATEQRGYRTAVFPFAIESGAGEFLTSPPSPVWIDDLFELIMQSVLDDDVVRVMYDSSYGFPKSVEISRGYRAADADEHYEILDFEVLEYR